MSSNNAKQSTSPAPAKKPGKNLLCEILIFCLVYAVCAIGNLGLSVVLLECFMPLLGNASDFSVSGDPADFAANVLSTPYLPLLTLFSTAATIVIVLVFCRWIQKRSWASIGLSGQKAFPHYVRGLLCGAAIFSAAVALCAVTGAGYFDQKAAASPLLILLFFLAYLIQGASEEILCRGYFMNSIARRYPMWLAVIVNSVFFMLLHIQNSGLSATALVNLFLFGVFASVLTLRTGSIWYASGFHSAWNFFQGNVYGIKVSGMEMHGSLFHFISDPSKTCLNGGDFGIEGSLLCTALFLIGILVLLRHNHREKQQS